MENFMNVREPWMLYDTIGAFNNSEFSTFNHPDGWFNSLAAMGAQNTLDFFNVRSRSIGLPYNNQDSRDQLAFGFILKSIGVSFFCQSLTQAPALIEGPNTAVTDKPDEDAPQVFCGDLPGHCGMKLKVQQDDLLKLAVPIAPAGYGPVGDGWARGSFETLSESYQVGDSTAYDHAAWVTTQGVPELRNRWPFPDPIMIPKNATINVQLQFNEYARAMLQILPDEFIFFPVMKTSGYIKTRPFWGIQVSLIGERLVQQRGAYHK